MVRGAWDWIIASALFALALWQYVVYVPTTDFHRDEARWIHRARFIEQALDPLGAYWMDQDLTQGQPPLGSYVTGLGLLLQGRDVETNELWSFHFSEAWNIRHGRMPSPEDHTAARQSNAVIGALIVVSVYFIGQQLSNRVAGVIGALLFVPHPLAIYLSSLAGWMPWSACSSPGRFWPRSPSPSGQPGGGRSCSASYLGWAVPPS